MTRETVILIVAGYLGLVTIVMGMLMMAKRGDEAVWEAEEARSEEPRGRDAA